MTNSTIDRLRPSEPRTLVTSVELEVSIHCNRAGFPLSDYERALVRFAAAEMFRQLSEQGLITR